MAGVFLLVTFFLLHLITIVSEKGKKCWAEKKFWITVVFMTFLLSIAIYGNASLHESEESFNSSQKLHH